MIKVYLNGYWYWIDYIVDENGDAVAGEKDSSILGVYGWATVYSGEKKINTIKD